jgi:RNA polymerase sigma factor (TIGR02999 family)
MFVLQLELRALDRRTWSRLPRLSATHRRWADGKEDRVAGDITALLARARAGDEAAAREVLPLVHGELHRLALQRMRQQPANHTLQPTDLVNEAFVKLFHGADGTIHDRAHFMALAATTMRSILVDHARHKGRDKRSADGERVVLDEVVIAYEDRSVDLIALHEALERLAQWDAELVKLVELRFFAGLSVDEVARLAGKSRRTTERELQVARHWLARELA